MSVKIYPDGKSAVVTIVNRPLNRSAGANPKLPRPQTAKNAISAHLYKIWKMNWEKQQHAVKKALEELREVFSKYDAVIKFHIDHTMDNELIMQVVNKRTGKLVFQIPSEYAIAVRRYAKMFPGIFLNKLV